MTLDRTRYKFILEFLAFWGGWTTAGELATVLGIERETAQKTIINPFKREFPGALEYDEKSRRTFRLGDAQGLKFSPNTPTGVTAIAAAEAIIKAACDAVPFIDVPVEDVGLVADILEDPDVSAFKTLFSALRHRVAVSLDYLSKAGRMAMRFSPHSLVRTSFRLHFRGYADTMDNRPGIYIDVVPERVLHAKCLDHSHYVGDRGDSDWHRRVHVEARLRDDLPEAIADALRQEYRLEPGGSLRTAPIRAATAEYVAVAFEARRVYGWDQPVWSTEVKEQ